MPTPAQMTGMRARYKARLPRTCTVPGTRKNVGAGDGTFQAQTEPGTPGVKCSFKAAGGNTPVVLESQTPIYGYVLRFEFGVELKAGMIIPFDPAPELGEPAITFKLIAPRKHVFQVGQEWTADEYHG